MSRVLPNELVRARELIDQANFSEALEIIENFENVKNLSPEDQLSALLLRGQIYGYNEQHEKAAEISEKSYELSQNLGMVLESIRALIGRAYIGFVGNPDKASSYLSEAEQKLTSLPSDSSRDLIRAGLLRMKSWMLFFRVDLKEAEIVAQESLKIIKTLKLSNKLDFAGTYLVLGWISLFQGKRPQALDYAMESLDRYKELNHNVAIATAFRLLGVIYFQEGDYNQALDYYKQSLAIEEISRRGKLLLLGFLAQIHSVRGELNRSLKYREQALELAEELNSTDQIMGNLAAIGYLYEMFGKFEQALEYYERHLTLAEKWGYLTNMAGSLNALVRVHLNKNSREIAIRYLSRLSTLFEQTKKEERDLISYFYLISKAYMMKTSARIRDRMEAQALYKEIIDKASGTDLVFSMGHLCDLLLEELSMSNDPEILNEITPLIAKSLEMAESLRNYVWLAETKLLQAKLALVQHNIEEAQKLMIEAQRIADLHGLGYLASMISSEHDKLLEQIELWDSAKKKEAPIAERITMASASDVLERIQGKRAVETPDTTDEQSTVLLILAEGGILIFSYPFSDEWKVDEDVFSSFLSAFTSFSTEFFSKGLDRARFGDDMMLMESIGSFSFCYLFKGQTYLARQKLSKFTEELQKDKTLWQNLEQYSNTSQVLKVNDVPLMKNLIADIFQK